MGVPSTALPQHRWRNDNREPIQDNESPQAAQVEILEGKLAVLLSSRIPLKADLPDKLPLLRRCVAGIFQEEVHDRKEVLREVAAVLRGGDEAEQVRQDLEGIS